MVDITTEVTVDSEQLQDALAGDQEQAMEFIMLLDEAVADFDFTLRLFERLGRTLLSEISHHYTKDLIEDDLNSIVDNFKHSAEVE